MVVRLAKSTGKAGRKGPSGAAFSSEKESSASRGDFSEGQQSSAASPTAVVEGVDEEAFWGAQKKRQFRRLEEVRRYFEEAEAAAASFEIGDEVVYTLGNWTQLLAPELRERVAAAQSIMAGILQDPGVCLGFMFCAETTAGASARRKGVGLFLRLRYQLAASSATSPFPPPTWRTSTPRSRSTTTQSREWRSQTLQREKGLRGRSQDWELSTEVVADSSAPATTRSLCARYPCVRVGLLRSK